MIRLYNYSTSDILSNYRYFQHYNNLFYITLYITHEKKPLHIFHSRRDNRYNLQQKFNVRHLKSHFLFLTQLLMYYKIKIEYIYKFYLFKLNQHQAREKAFRTFNRSVLTNLSHHYEFSSTGAV